MSRFIYGSSISQNTDNKLKEIIYHNKIFLENKVNDIQTQIESIKNNFEKAVNNLENKDARLLKEHNKFQTNDIILNKNSRSIIELYSTKLKNNKFIINNLTEYRFLISCKLNKIIINTNIQSGKIVLNAETFYYNMNKKEFDLDIEIFKNSKLEIFCDNVLIKPYLQILFEISYIK